MTVHPILAIIRARGVQTKKVHVVWVRLDNHLNQKLRLIGFGIRVYSSKLNTLALPPKRTFGPGGKASSLNMTQ